MNIHLITYLTSKLFWIYTVFRYNTILYPKNEDTQKLFAYFCAYLLSCWGSMQWGTMYGDLIFELIALLIITVAYGFHKTKGQRTVCTGHPRTFRQHWRPTDL